MARLGFVDTEGNVFHINQNPDNSVLRKKKKNEETAPAMAAVSKQPSTEVKDVRTVDTVSQFKETQKNLKKAEKNLNEKTEARQKKEAEIYKKEGQSFIPEFKKNGVISYQTKDENQPSALPEVKITRAEMDKKVSKELDEEEKAFDKWKIANYENNMARVNSEDTTLYDKTIGTDVCQVR